MTRGDVFFVDFGIPFGSEPGYHRPVIVIQSDRENLDALNTKVVIPLTSNLVHADTPGNVLIPKHISGLSKDSVALLHQIIVVDKFREFIKNSFQNMPLLETHQTIFLGKNDFL